MSINGLKRGMLQILIANILNMFFSIGTNFLLPKFLSIESYSQIKTFQLYITYAAVLHFGYNDGMYLKFGGKSIEAIPSEEIQTSISTLRIFQFFITVCTTVFAFFVRDKALWMAAMATLPLNLIAYFKNFYQATGEFKKYSRIMNMTTGLTFLINLCLIAVVRTDNYLLYLIGYVVLDFALCFILEYSLRKAKHFSSFRLCFSWKELKENISSGILLLLGNFSSQLLTSMDRWFVKILLGSFSFAQYAFAVSMENFLNVAITPISVTMYNYFCRHDAVDDIARIREWIIAFASVIIMAAFPVKFILEIFLTQYLDSINIIFLLFAAQAFYVIIKSVYVNLYKARKIQSKYFSKLCIIVVVAFVFNVVCYGIYHVKESFAVGTLLSSIVWFFLCNMDFKEIPYSPRHYVYIFAEVIVFLFCGAVFPAITGCLIYAAATLVMMVLFLPKSVNAFWAAGKSILSKYKRL